MTKRFCVTTPIYYVNDKPHVGHAYTTLAADVLARWKRLDGYDVFFLTGTDENATKVAKAAAEAGMEPLPFTDRVSQNFRDLTAVMNISNDDFIRTTEPRHAAACQALWTRLAQADQIYLGHYDGWYAVRDEAFYDPEELTLRQDGVRVAPSGAPVEWVEEPSYFFRLSRWQQPLLDFYEANPDFIAPASRRNEVMSFVRGGLKDLSVSRATTSWGVAVPGDPAHRMYVWLDALTNYLTATRGAEGEGPHPAMWPADLHLVGKDIIRFHAVYWPAFLMAAGLPLPKRVFAHGWWTNEGQKISKSLGNVIDPNELVATYGLDAVRYFLLREVPFGQDGDFSRRALVGRMNNELANDLGNLAQRTLSLIARNCEARLPAAAAPTAEDAELLTAAEALVPTLRAALDAQAFHTALEEAWKVIRAANAYIDRQAPWALRRTDPARMAAVLRVLADALRHVATVLLPFMPDAMGRMLDQLGVPPEARALAALANPLPAGTALPPPQGVFPRFVEEAA
jgi:methionyl-tRNA synthetase